MNMYVFKKIFIQQKYSIKCFSINITLLIKSSFGNDNNNKKTTI